VNQRLAGPGERLDESVNCLAVVSIGGVDDGVCRASLVGEKGPVREVAHDRSGSQTLEHRRAICRTGETADVSAFGNQSLRD
jgi:hypothetical protein